MAPWPRAGRTSTATLVSRRCLHTTAPRQSSPFFALARLSNSRETQHFSKVSKLSRVEHSPSLQLIQSSEVLPFAPPPTPSTTPASQALVKQGKTEAVVATDGVSIKKAREETDLLSVGRAILAEKNAEISRLQRVVNDLKDRAAKRDAAHSSHRAETRMRVRKLDGQNEILRFWLMVVCVGGAGYLLWPYLSTPWTKKSDHALVLSRDIQTAETDSQSPVVSPEPVIAAAPTFVDNEAGVLRSVDATSLRDEPVLLSPVNTPLAKASWWGRMFWTR